MWEQYMFNFCVFGDETQEADYMETVHPVV